MPAIGAAKSVAASTTRIPSSGLSQIDRQPEADVRRALQRACEQQLQRELRRLRAAVDVPLGAFGGNAEPPLRIAKRVRPSECSLSVQFQTSGSLRSSRPAAAASCHSSSVGSRAPCAAAYARASASDSPVTGSLPDGDREAAPRSRTVDLDEVVQARRQRLPFLDVRHLAVDARLAPAEPRPRLRGLDRDEPVGHGGDARLGCVEPHRLPRRVLGGAAAEDSNTRGRDGCEPERRQREGKAAPVRARRRPRTARRHGSRAPTAPRHRAASSSRRPAGRRCEQRAASTRRASTGATSGAARRPFRAATRGRARSSRPTTRRRSPRRARRRRSAKRCAAPRRDCDSSGACGGACAAARTSARGSRRARPSRRTTAPTTDGDLAIRASGSVDSPSKAASGSAARSSGIASFIVSRKTPSAPSSRTSSATAAASPTGSRRVPTSHGL